MVERTCIHGLVESAPCQECYEMPHNKLAEHQHKEIAVLRDKLKRCTDALVKAYPLVLADGNCPAMDPTRPEIMADVIVEDRAALREEVARLRKVLYLISHVEEGCGGNLTHEEMVRSAVSQALAALEVERAKPD